MKSGTKNYFYVWLFLDTKSGADKIHQKKCRNSKFQPFSQIKKSSARLIRLLQIEPLERPEIQHAESSEHIRNQGPKIILVSCFLRTPKVARTNSAKKCRNSKFLLFSLKKKGCARLIRLLQIEPLGWSEI